MKEIDDGGPAFVCGSNTGGFMSRGMSLRDYFAAKAMQSLILEPRTVSPNVPLSARAYEIADAMLRRRAE